MTDTETILNMKFSSCKLKLSTHFSSDLMCCSWRSAVDLGLCFEGVARQSHTRNSREGTWKMKGCGQLQGHPDVVSYGCNPVTKEWGEEPLVERSDRKSYSVGTNRAVESPWLILKKRPAHTSTGGLLAILYLPVSGISSLQGTRKFAQGLFLDKPVAFNVKDRPIR